VKLLLDTHIWIWMLSDTARLAPKIANTLQDPANELWLSPISIWELLILVEKRRVSLEMGTEEWIAQEARIAPIKEAPLTAEVVLATRQIRLPHRDPADMFLAATAKVFELTLVTSDAHLLAVKEISLLRA
jgi:PIN domain nuclease of toxin-antitoxin system